MTELYVKLWNSVEDLFTVTLPVHVEYSQLLAVVGEVY